MIKVNLKYCAFSGGIIIHKATLYNDNKEKHPVLRLDYTYENKINKYYSYIHVNKNIPTIITYQDKTYTLDNDKTLLQAYNVLDTAITLNNL